MRAVLLCGVVLGLCVPEMARADEVVLEPSSKWHLDYSVDKCRLVRTFGDGEQRTILLLDQHQPNDSFTWTLAGKPVASFATGRRFNAQFGPTLSSMTIEQSPSAFTGELEGYGKAVIVHGHLGDVELKQREDKAERPGPTPIGLPQLDTGPVQGVEWIELRRGENNSLRLVTGSMQSTFAAMNQCMASLVKSWGLDVETQALRASGPAWTNVQQVARSIQRDYPSEALRRGQQARINVRIMIDESGKPTQCVRTDVTTADNFSDKPCQIILRQAKFEPARDASGNGLKSYYTTDIVYTIG